MSKHHNIITTCPLYHRHKSKAEAKRCAQLLLFMKSRVYRWFGYEPRVDLNGVAYTPDFITISMRGNIAFEEIKSPHLDGKKGRWGVIQTLWLKHGPGPLYVIHNGRGGLKTHRTTMPATEDE